MSILKICLALLLILGIYFYIKNKKAFTEAKKEKAEEKIQITT